MPSEAYESARVREAARRAGSAADPLRSELELYLEACVETCCATRFLAQRARSAFEGGAASGREEEVLDPGGFHWLYWEPCFGESVFI